ncbi:MAG TPA: hypothetical protein PK470_02840 [Candidatus Omnitrophota bacterium]|nr:hypothetical protein [Candidatus Omnitrophota bacterium]
MGKKKRDYPKIKKSRIPLAGRIIIVYYLVLVSLVVLAIQSGQPLQVQREDVPVSLLDVIKFTYYVLPVLLAVMYGAMFRPFWAKFRDLLVLVLVIHGAYSVFVYSCRVAYFERLRNETFKLRLAQYSLYGVQHRMLDTTKDGLIDRVEFRAKLDAAEFPPGQYIVYAKVTQRGKEFSDSVIGRFPFRIFPTNQKPFIIQFASNPQLFESYYESGYFDLNFGLQRVVGVDESGYWLLALSRWSPFIRFTNWNGEDPAVQNAVLDLDYREKVDSFYIMPLKFQKLQVKLAGSLSDFVVDEDGNGKYYAVIVTIPLDSDYEGDVFIQAIVRGAAYPLTFEGGLDLGDNLLQIRLDSDYIRELGEDGPYELIDFQIFNQNPECLEDECLKRIKPNFIFYLDDYTTQPYKLEQFDRIKTG